MEFGVDAVAVTLRATRSLRDSLQIPQSRLEVGQKPDEDALQYIVRAISQGFYEASLEATSMSKACRGCP